MKIRKYAILLLLVMLVSVPLTSFTIEAPDPARNVGISLFYKNGTQKVSGAQFDLYLVAQAGSDGWDLVDPFDNYSISLDGDMSGLASTLEGYVLRDRLTPTQGGRTNVNGFLRLPAQAGTLKHGLYLLVARDHEQDGKIYYAQPVMLQLPGLSEDGTKWKYDLLVNIKFETDENPDDPLYVTRKVLKAWDDPGHETERPQEVVVQLFKDGELYDTVTLNAQNTWRWQWTELDAHSRWHLVEKDVENYTATVTQEGITFLVTNKYKKPETTPTPPGMTPTPTPPGMTPTPTTVPTATPTPVPTATPTPKPSQPTLPQTGQLWWPVPLMVCAGLLLIVVGLLRRRSEEYEE
ncbi:MAG: Cna B-type domain-containing protein [Clostridia bacterium]|nr:Cna B-type domain-containing protein [Clostridia bacterium]